MNLFVLNKMCLNNYVDYFDIDEFQHQIDFVDDLEIEFLESFKINDVFINEVRNA